MKLSVPAFAKINLWLEVLGRREDSFHEVRTLYQTVDLQDYLTVETSPSGVHLEVEGRPTPSGPENLVHQAADLLLRTLKPGVGLRIWLKKGIPVGAGLGGGSADAALTLVTANDLFGGRLTIAELEKLGATLGSDVNYFLHGGLALGLGRGEKIYPLSTDESAPVRVLIVWPNLFISSGEAYGLLGASRLPLRLTQSGTDTTIRRFREGVESGDWGFIRNDLEEAVLGRFSKIRELRENLLAAGCSKVLLSGSGSAMFAIGTPRQLNDAADRCRERNLGEIFHCRTLSQREYRRRLSESGIQLFST